MKHVPTFCSSSFLHHCTFAPETWTEMSNTRWIVRCLYQSVPWLWQKGGSWPSMKKHIGHIFGAVITCCKALTVVNEENLLERLRVKLSVAWSYCETSGLEQNQSMWKQTAAYCNKNISDQCGSQRRPCESRVGNFLYMETEWAYFGQTMGKKFLWFKSC